jgi:hypothetical protein
MAMAIVEHCRDEDRHWTLNRLPDCTGICGSLMLHILQQDLKVHRMAAKFVT